MLEIFLFPFYPYYSVSMVSISSFEVITLLLALKSFVLARIRSTCLHKRNSVGGPNPDT